MSSSVGSDVSVKSVESRSDGADEQRCPLCGGLNQCAVAAQTEPSACWCFQADVSLTELLRQQADLPGDYSRQTSCICPGCASRLISEQARIP
ncbi:cysteine-rich CWC family protein [Thalassolituus pacificus]|uniref:cysteine-rich CWC family protein n=1 Tax=Thalassolituus pacificus TaxID=2975440 RepID=UPI003B846DB7